MNAEGYTRKRWQARENAHDQFEIGYGFVSDKMSIGRTFFKPVEEHCNVKSKQFWIQLSALNWKGLMPWT